ncbi:FAT-domain-containing protein [Anaeromyces robustus]|uniref:FAT-domain-containing protein n=1 Tax=Anaeromyces robustus TaxID=1754192 RepID=A0A1Y1WU66_9FUNG|nr:FAT-domain-containing protein [Anaeromyces robustus]|eukprot:ORX76848.1 FAT-domain-containing protein [Anaeromyces robustus]
MDYQNISKKMDLASIATRLNDQNIDIKVKITILNEIKDSIETIQAVEYSRFLNLFFPVFFSILTQTQPSFISTNPQQKLRNTVLEIIQRIPHTEALQEYVPKLMEILLDLLKKDNEENGTICVKIIVDLHKNNKNILEKYVQDFFDIVKEMYGNIKQTVTNAFGDNQQSLNKLENEAVSNQNSKLAKSMYSFKILKECPIIIVLLFQLHKKFVQSNVVAFIPLIIECLELQPEAQKKEHEEARKKGEIFIGVSPKIKNRTAYVDLKALQVKTLSFVAYISRGFIQLLEPHQDNIAKSVIQLMKDCPPDASGIRKELLIATRHIWYTKFKLAFIKHIDTLLNENVFVGTGVTSRETLRSLAYSILADLLHNVRSELSQEQLSKTIYIYSRNLHDQTISPNIQTMCVKLLVNLVEEIVKLDNEIEARKLLVRLLDTFSKKILSINTAFPIITKHYNSQKQQLSQKSENFADINPPKGYLDLEYAHPIRSCMGPFDTSQDLIKEIKLLLKYLMNGCKLAVVEIKSCSMKKTKTDTDNKNKVNNSDFNEDEIEILIRVFREGLKFFNIYNLNNFDEDGRLKECSDLQKQAAFMQSNLPKDGKEMLDCFSALFITIEPYAFQEVLSSQMSFFYKQILINPNLVIISQAFLAKQIISPNFASILLNFLMEKLEELKEDNELNCFVLIRLFKFLFMSISLFPSTNENILKPHLKTLILKSLEFSSKAHNPLNYFTLLRSLFRSIGGGKFDQLYQEVFPLLCILLESLNSLLANTHKQHMKELFVELCLTVPVRLSVLIPYLSYLMKPLVIALKAGPELVSQGLRTLELCIDNLTQEFLDPIMNPVINDLMDALWKHLRPHPYNTIHSHTTLRILGKLGGRNRRMLRVPSELNYYKHDNALIDIGLSSNLENMVHMFDLEPCLFVIERLIDKNLTPNSIFYKEQMYQFIKSCIPLLFNIETGSSELSSLINKYINSKENFTNIQVIEEEDYELLVDRVREKTKVQIEPSYMAVKKVLYCLYSLASQKGFEDKEVIELCKNMCIHFSILHVEEIMLARSKFNIQYTKISSLDVKFSPFSTQIDAFVDAIVDVIASEEKEKRIVGEKAIILFYDTCKSLLGNNKDILEHLPVFHKFSMRFCLYCFKQEWYYKNGGCFGISLLCSKIDLGTKWMLDHELEFVKSLLYVLKDTSPEMSSNNIEDATKTLSHVLKVCNRDNDEGQDRQGQFKNLILLLVSELPNSNSEVRKTVQWSLQLLADLTGNEVTDLLLPVKENLLKPIFAKPLRTLPFSMQIGHIDAVTYCLSLRPPLLQINEDLTRLITEAQALADAEDQSLIGKGLQHRNASSLVKLRVTCIKLLSTALNCEDSLLNKQNISKRNRIISVFFKSLYSNSNEVVEVANKGLKQVLQQQSKLPKDLLQAGLQPILTKLSDYKSLTVQGLEGLERLLELLNNYFKINIGYKLLEHMKSWEEIAIKENNINEPLLEVESIKIIVHILDVFYQLPPAAHVLLDQIITFVIEIEDKLKRKISSPFRKPLIKYLNKYVAKSIEYFYKNLYKPNVSKLFIDILKSEYASVLRLEIINNPNNLIEHTFAIKDDNPNSDELHYQGILIVNVLCKSHTDWLVQNNSIIEKVLEVWESPYITSNINKEEVLSYSRLQENIYILEILINYCVNKSLDNSDYYIKIIFSMIRAFCYSSIIDYDLLKQFLWEDVALKYTDQQKKIILNKFLDLFSDSNTSQIMKIQTFKYLINPMLYVSFTKCDNSNIIDEEIIEKIHLKLWDPFLLEQSVMKLDDSLKIELLQFTTLLVQYVPQIICNYRKDIIKLEWNLIKVDDLTCKQTAYVALARFIEAFDTPGKIVVQIFAALLRAHQPEGRILVKQALDILILVLPKRITSLPGQQNDPKFPTWVRWTRKIIIEDSQNIAQLVIIFQLLIRHSELFYSSRKHFIPQIIISLTKLGLTPNTAYETRQLTVELVELILNWEKKYSEENKKDLIDNNSENQGNIINTMSNNNITNKDQINNFVSIIDPNSQEMMITYLIKLLAILNPMNDNKNLLAPRIIPLIKELLILFPDVNIKISQIEKFIRIEPNENQINAIKTILDVLKIIVDEKSNSWFIENLSALAKYLISYIKCENTIIMTSVGDLLISIFKKIYLLNKEGKKLVNDIDPLMKEIEHIVMLGLNNMNNIFSVITLIEATYHEQPEKLDNLIPLLIKLLQKLVKDHISIQNNNNNNQNNINEGSSQSSSNTIINNNNQSVATLLIMLLNLLKLRISNMGDNRRQVLIAIIQLIEKSKDINLLRNILTIVSDWILKKTESFPTMKEKANIMIKMMVFERRDKSLLEDYLLLVSKIYSDSFFSRSELTIKLEQAFLLGTRNENPEIRRKFAQIFDKSIGKGLFTRLNYVIGVQNWEFLSTSFWLHQALDILLGAYINTKPLYQMSTSYRIVPISHVESIYRLQLGDIYMEIDNDNTNSIIENHQKFLKEMKKLDVSNLITTIRQLIYLDIDMSSQIWINTFVMSWSFLKKKERHDIIKVLIVLLAREYHLKQADFRPNVIQILLEGICRSVPTIQLPPQLIKYLGRTFNAWHIAIELLQNNTPELKYGVMSSTKDEEKIKECTMDALASLYEELNENDYFYGLWRRRCLFQETNIAISYEQCGKWNEAQYMYEAAQKKARLGSHIYNESEYYLWEDHWILCAQKLQQWDILTDLAKHEGNTDLLLECAWRVSDWDSESEFLQKAINVYSDIPIARRKIFEAFLLLNQSQDEGKMEEFKKVYDEGVQLTLKKWHMLPEVVSYSHINLLHIFQQFIELNEANQIRINLNNTNIDNIEKKSDELKGILQTWRERLPNYWEDINLWSDLVAWRQHIFSTINKAYLPIIHILNKSNTNNNSNSTNNNASTTNNNNNNNNNGNNNNSSINNNSNNNNNNNSNNNNNAASSYTYRGFHETAWIINRFAHIARKHGLTDICINSLSKIYTLPNIEIQEAFYKLREQAKCYFQSSVDYATGLDVINNTNLMYFTDSQTSEFWTLKGQFLSKLNLIIEANEAFSTATKIEMKSPKAWAQWGIYNDNLFKEHPNEINYGEYAISCYLQASGLYKNYKSRKYIARILWLLSFDDSKGKLTDIFKKFKGDHVHWYWIIYIPQLLTCLANKEAECANIIIQKIAKSYPQALYFLLRTTKEDYKLIKKQAAMASNGVRNFHHNTEDSQSKVSNSSSTSIQSQQTQKFGGSKKQPWDYVDEIMDIVKTSFPLLTLSIEKMIDQIIQKLKPSPDEDIYRLIVALLTDGVQQLVGRITNLGDTRSLPSGTEANLKRFHESMSGGHHKYKDAFEEDFIKSKPSMTELVEKFRDWRDKLEYQLDLRNTKQQLEYFSHDLVEFEHKKFDDIEIPGQYLLHKDNNNEFIKIDKFESVVDVVRGHGICYRRLSLRGHDGSLHPFIVQHPAARQCRREERIVQLFRIMNNIMERKKDCRKYNIAFHLPLMIPLAPQVRLVQDDLSYISLQEIYEKHCEKSGFHKDDPTILYINSIRNIINRDKKNSIKRTKNDITNLKMAIIQQIEDTMVPNTVLTKYVTTKMKQYIDLFILRKQFTYQMAAVSFMSYVMSIAHRYPHKINISFKTGNIWATELLPSLSPSSFLFGSNEPVPFRFTPNIQTFITPTGVEGVFINIVMSIARSLTEPEFELENYLGIFIKDEIISIQNISKKNPTLQDNMLRNYVAQNINLIQHRAESLSCKQEREKLKLYIENQRDKNTGNINKSKLNNELLVGEIKNNKDENENKSNVKNKLINTNDINNKLNNQSDSNEANKDSNKNENDTFNIPANQTLIDLISQATNPHKLSQLDITWMPYY